MNRDMFREHGLFPLQNVTHDMYPPVCIKTHWDPTTMLNHILPKEHISLQTDFRPWTSICKEYRTTGPVYPTILTPSDVVFPSGGKFYPPDRYSRAIDVESELRNETRPLNKWCTSRNLIIPASSTLYKRNYTVPKTKEETHISELSFPRALLRPNEYHCRTKEDIKNISRSNLLFNNTTRQDRYKINDNLNKYNTNSYVPTVSEGNQAPV